LPAKATVTLYDLLGQKIKEYSFNRSSGGEVELDLEKLNLRSGSYSLEIHSEGHTSTHKIIYESK
jgi:hypothetical protein